ncbi:MAG TPA: hypothetical protein PLS90_09510 [Candidatus Sumerlaeota bacterium]|nr:hypothetical protein [Candidatus Sumerlaeota bacterium]
MFGLKTHSDRAIRLAAFAIVALAAAPSQALDEIAWLDLEGGLHLLTPDGNTAGTFADTQTVPGSSESNIFLVAYDRDKDGLDELIIGTTDESRPSDIGLLVWDPKLNSGAGGVVVPSSNLNVISMPGIMEHLGAIATINPEGTPREVVVQGAINYHSSFTFLDGSARDANNNIVADSTYGGWQVYDLDGNGADEIFYFRGTGLYYREYDGQANVDEVFYANIPIPGGPFQRWNFLLLIGDVDGDSEPDILFGPPDPNDDGHMLVYYHPLLVPEGDLPLEVEDLIDSGMEISRHAAPGGGRGGGGCLYTLGQMDADPQLELLHINDDGWIAIIDLVDKTETVLNGVGPGVSNRENGEYSLTTAGYSALTTGNFSSTGGGEIPNRARHWSLY